MVLVLVVENAGGGVAIAVWFEGQWGEAMTASRCTQAEEIQAGKWEKMGGEGWRIGGSPVWQPLYEQGTWTR
jgi:hypothetical protein